VVLQRVHAPSEHRARQPRVPPLLGLGVLWERLQAESGLLPDVRDWVRGAVPNDATRGPATADWA